MYCLLSWDFNKYNIIAPFNQSFILNQFINIINNALWFRRSYYDITKNRNNEKYTARPTTNNWQNVNSKSEEALNTKAPPEGFGFLIEMFLNNYLCQFIQDTFAKQIFLSELIIGISTNITSFNSLYHILAFLADINQENLNVINMQNLKQFQSMIGAFVNKFGPLYKNKLIPLICKVIAIHMDKKMEFYAVCKLIYAMPKRCIIPSVTNKGFMCLKDEWNKSDWIGKQLLILIQQYIIKPNKLFKINIIGNMLQFIECSSSFHDIINILFEIASVSYSQPYKSQEVVLFCIQLLSYVINLSEKYPKIFIKHHKILQERMSKPMNEILLYTFDKQLINTDFSCDKNWIFDLSSNLIKCYGNKQSIITSKFKTIFIHICSKKGYYEIQDFPSLFILTLMIKYHYTFTKTIMENIQMNTNKTIQNDLLMLLVSIQLNPCIKKTHYPTLQTLQFNGILGILSEKNIIINTEIARQIIQFCVDALDMAQGEIKATILECISLLLSFAKLSISNLKVLSDAAWYILSDTNRICNANNYCIQLLLFPILFNDINLHKEDGHIRKQIMRTLESKKSTII
eukprot:458364_1